MVTLGRGLLYTRDWTQVRHAVFTREDSNSWKLVGSFGRNGQPDEDVAGDPYGLMMGQGPPVPGLS